MQTTAELISKMVNNFDTKFIEGFTYEEIDDLKEEVKSKFPYFNQDKYESALCGNTCIMKKGQIITYSWDIEKALICAVENRDLTQEEFD